MTPIHISKSKKPNFQEETFIEKVCNDAYIDWAMSFSVSALLVVFAAFVGVRAYISTSDALDPSSFGSTASRASFDAKKLRSVLESFDSRVDSARETRRVYTGPADPSL